MLKNEQREVSRARSDLASSLDEIERRLAPNNVAKVGWWWVKRQSRVHPVAWTIGAVAAVALIVGLVSWAALDDSDD